MNRHLEVCLFGLLAAAYLLGTSWLIESRYVLGVMSTAAALAVIALGVWTTLAIGRVNFGQSAFALIGAYVVAIGTTRWGLSFWLALPLAGLVAALVGIVLGLGILRLRGVYFAMITLSLTEAVRLAILNGGDFTGGAVGISGIPLPGELSLFGVELIGDFAAQNSHLALFHLSTLLLLGAIALCWRLDASRIGGVFQSMQQSEELAQSLGINLTQFRIVAFGIGSFLGGIGGGYFAAAQQSVYSGGFGVPDSVSLVLYCFLGGAAYVAGPVVGTFLLFLGLQYLQEFQEYQNLIYAMLMIGVMIWLPNGILSLREWQRGGRR